MRDFLDNSASSRPTLFRQDPEPSPARLVALAALVAMIFLTFFKLIVMATANRASEGNTRQFVQYRSVS